MSRLKCLTGIALTLALANAQADSNESWLSQIGGKGADLVFDLVETPDGRLCATGTFWDKVTFGTGDHQTTLEALEAQDIYVACYTSAGQLTFATEFGAHRGDDPRAIAALPGGDLIVAGFFASEFGAGKSRALKANGNGDIFITRLDQAGKAVWSRQFGGKFSDIGTGLAITADGDILLAGDFQLTMGYKINGEVEILTSAGSRDAFVMKLNADGEVSWVRRFGGAGYDSAKSVASDHAGNVYVAGRFHKSAGFDENGERITSRGHADLFLTSYTPAGEPRWVRHIGGIQQEDVTGLVVNNAGHVYLAGNYQNEIVLSEQTRLTNAGVTDVFVACYDGDGNLDKAVSFGGPGIEQAFDMALTANQSLLLAGHFQDNTDFAPGERKEVRRSSSKGNSDAFVVTLDSTLDFVGARTFGGKGLEMVLSVAALKDSSVALAGVFNKPFKLGVDDWQMADRGKTDVFLVRLAAQQDILANK